jgi:molecular chaperone GrpE
MSEASNSAASKATGEPTSKSSGPAGTSQAAAAYAEAAREAGGAPAEGAGTAATGTTEAAGGLAALAEALARAQAETVELRDLYLRAKADIENTRRRGEDNVAKAHKFAIEGFAESLLPVKDSLEMALKTDAPSLESLREGVEATLRLLSAAFGRHKLLEIDPVGQKFDPNQHQAISMVPGATLEPPVAPNHVVAVLQKGYLINDRVLRPAMVTVAQA